RLVGKALHGHDARPIVAAIHQHRHEHEEALGGKFRGMWRVLGDLVGVRNDDDDAAWRRGWLKEDAFAVDAGKYRPADMVGGPIAMGRLHRCTGDADFLDQSRCAGVYNAKFVLQILTADPGK